MGQPIVRQPLAKKVEILDEYAAGGISQGALAEKHGVSAQSVYTWNANEKAIRAAYAKELKQAEKANGASTNGSNGHAKATVKPAAEEAPAAKLQILGLTPLIKELVRAELKRELPGLLKEAIDAAFSRKPAN